MDDATPKLSADKAALGASLPGAAAHVASRLLFRWLLLPLALVVPIGGFAGLAWRLAHLRPSAEEVAAAQAAVAKLTDEAEGRVDEALRSDADPDIHPADARRNGARTKDRLKAQLAGLAGTLTVLQTLPTAEEELVRADELRRQGYLSEAATRYENIAWAFERSDPRLALAARLTEAQLLVQLGDRHGAKRAFGRYMHAASAISSEVAAKAVLEYEKAFPQTRP